jgi:hypothetical protein
MTIGAARAAVQTHVQEPQSLELKNSPRFTVIDTRTSVHVVVGDDRIQPPAIILQSLPVTA